MSLEIKRLRRSKLTIPEIANVLKISKHKVKTITREMPDNNSITHEIKKDLGFQMFLEKLKEKFNGEILYHSGYEHSDKAVSLKCAAYNHEFKMTAQIIRHKRDTKCPECKKLDKEFEKYKPKQKLMVKDKRVKNKIKITLTKMQSSLREVFINECNYCSKLFAYKNNHSKYCSKKCKQGKSSIKKDIRKRRMKINGRIDSDISLPKLVDRDNNICYLCKDECDYEDFTKDCNGYFIAGNNYPSIEHIIPVSKGGTHTWDNIKLAHFYCNVLKSNK